MNTARARAAARGWVAGRTAFLTGSTVARTPAAPHPPTSDVDVVLVGTEEPPNRRWHRGVLLDVSTLPGITEDLAASWVFAPSFAGDHALGDPTGRLGALRRDVEPSFAA